MAGRCCPARCRKLAPVGSFPFGQIHQSVARKRHWRDAVGLRTEARAMPLREFMERREVAIVGKLGQGPAPIVPYGCGLVADVAHQRGQEWREIVAAAL